MDRKKRWQTDVTKCLDPSSNTDHSLDNRSTPNGAVSPSIKHKIYNPTVCTHVVLAEEMHWMGQEDHKRNERSLSRLSLRFNSWRSFQASSRKKLLPWLDMPEKYSYVKKGSKTDYGINYYEVTSPCLLSSSGKIRFSPVKGTSSLFISLLFQFLPCHAMGWLLGCILIGAALGTYIIYSCYGFIFLSGRSCDTWLDSSVKCLRLKVKDCVRNMSINHHTCFAENMQTPARASEGLLW